jgi:hypothetical protein
MSKYRNRFTIHPSFLENHPEEAFRLYLNKLNNKNLKELLLFSSFVSLFDYYDTMDYGHNYFAPIINVEQINLLTQAIIRSKSQFYKSDVITRNDLEYFYTYWLNIIGIRSKNVKEENGAEKALIRNALGMINQQNRYQNYHVLQREIRSLLLYNDIPERYKDRLSNDLGNKFVTIPDEFKAKTGITIVDYIVLGLFLIFQYFTFFKKIYPQDFSKKNHDDFNKRFGDMREANNSGVNDFLLGQKIDALYLFFQKVKPELNKLIFNTNFITEQSCKHKFDSFYKSLSCNYPQIRKMIEDDKVFQEGIILDRLSPFERYPLIEMDFGNYIIPNFRYMALSVTDSIHYIMQEIFPQNEFNQTMGRIQEIYIQELLSSSFEPCLIIPEIEYKKGKELVKSPDFILLSNRLYIIETKCKRPSATLRGDPGSDTFSDQMENVIDAISKSKSKIVDIFNKTDVFSKWDLEIDKTKKEIPTVIIIIGEGFEIPMEILCFHVKFNNFADLQNYPYNFLFINLSILEICVEISSKQHVSITSIFDKISASNASINGYMGINGILIKEYGEISNITFPYFEKRKNKIQDLLIELTTKLIEQKNTT